MLSGSDGATLVCTFTSGCDWCVYMDTCHSLFSSSFLHSFINICYYGCHHTCSTIRRLHLQRSRVRSLVLLYSYPSVLSMYEHVFSNQLCVVPGTYSQQASKSQSERKNANTMVIETTQWTRVS